MPNQLTRLYLGGAIPAGQPDGGRDITDAEFDAWFHGIVPATFPDGWSLSRVDGGWRDSATGRTITERSWVLELAHDGGLPAVDGIRELAYTYRHAFHQDAVMVATIAAAVSFL